MTDTESLQDHLDDAIEALLRARLQLGSLDTLQPPALALDEALCRDPDYQVQRNLRDALANGNALDAEAAHHQAVARAVGVDWSVAATAFSNIIKENRNV